MGRVTSLLGQGVLASFPQPLETAVPLPTRNSLLITAEEHVCPSHGVQDEVLKARELPVDLAGREFGGAKPWLGFYCEGGEPGSWG